MSERVPGDERPAVPRRAVLVVDGPFAWADLLAWMTVRALPGVESITAKSYTTALHLAGGPAVVTITHRSPVAERGAREHANGAIVVEMHLTDPSDEAGALAMVRRFLDLDAPVDTIDAHLRDVPVIGELVADAPGMRIPGEATPLLALVRALAGQQVSVAGGLAQMYRLIELTHRDVIDGLSPFPDADTILDVGFDWYRGPSARRETIRRAVELAAAGGLQPERGTDVIARDLLALKGIGPWTVAYTLMRGYGDRDVDLSGDRALVNAARALGDVPLPTILDAARPYRSYAALHLWRGHGA